MVNVSVCTGTSTKQIFVNNELLTLDNIWHRFERLTGVSKENFYIIHNGRIVNQNDKFLDGCVTVIPRLFGGKGGFGSMLRAIGAQIEKTTNREACRDLSGRRLRDINEEKRLKAWIEKQAKRDKEAAERKKKKLERLCAEPKHEFKDQVYENERSILTERIGDAVEEGFKAAVAGTSGVKRKCEEEYKGSSKKTLFDLDIESIESDTSDDSEEEDVETVEHEKSEKQVSNDSGHSSDETDKSDVKLSEIKNVEETVGVTDEKINTENEVADKPLEADSNATESAEQNEITDCTDTKVLEFKS